MPVPAPVMRAPIAFKQLARSTTSGSTEAFSMIVVPEAKQAAQTLLDAELVCALGGEYQLSEPPRGLPVWTSTRWPDQEDQITGNEEPFTSPLLEWFRGMEADVAMLSDRVIAYAAVDMQRSPQPANLELKLPLFDLFRDNPFKRPKPETTPSEPEPFEELPPPEPAPDPSG